MGVPTVPPLNFNVTQQPVSRSGASTSGGSTTGAFFSKTQPDFQGPANLLTGGVSASVGGIGSIALGGAVLGLALLMRKK